MLLAAGLQPDRVTFNTLLKACMRGNLADKALHTFTRMRHLHVPVGSSGPLHSIQSCISFVMLKQPAGMTGGVSPPALIDSIQLASLGSISKQFYAFFIMFDITVLSYKCGDDDHCTSVWY